MVETVRDTISSAFFADLSFKRIKRTVYFACAVCTAVNLYVCARRRKQQVNIDFRNYLLYNYFIDISLGGANI